MAKPNRAILEVPGNMRYPQPLSDDRSQRRDGHRLELFDRRGRRIATLYGEREGDLRERAARWSHALGTPLTEQFTPFRG